MVNTVICLNNNCLKFNAINNKFCDQCGGKLLLRERYQAIKVIGQGGFGRTFLARDFDKPSKPYCVIKQFFPSAQGTDNIEKASVLFAQEAERLEELGKHPQIPELFAYFVTDDGQQYLVQEYIAGENLQQELSNHGVYKEAEVKELLIDILNILKFVHAKNVIHRDIKPENIIRRTSDQKLVLVDFGAAKYIMSPTALNVTGTVIGSAQYCAPEQSRGKPLFASDLYSLGVVCIHLLTLVDPFQLFDISENDWVWRDYLVNNPVSSQFGQVLDKMLAVGLKKRFSEVDQVFNSLNYQYSSPTPTVSPTPVSVSTSVPATTIQVSAPNIIEKNVLKIETVEFTTTKIKKADAEYVLENTQKTCQIATFKLGEEIILEMVKIPAGEYMMGAKPDENGSSQDEYPQHRVTIAKPFYIGKYPITQAQYKVIIEKNPSNFKGLNRPVERVSWDMAQAFCRKLSERMGNKFHLPSEAQWEYAGRAGTTTPFCFGETLTDQLANYDATSTYTHVPKGVYRQQTTDVGSFPPNAFGLYDIHGNVWEWCEDTYHPNYQSSPTDGSAWITEDEKYSRGRTLRGGAWNSNPNSCRMANRLNLYYLNINFNIGFRVICQDI
jgi:formylglycine-generating enzyme required for sulfatase activity